MNRKLNEIGAIFTNECYEFYYEEETDVPFWKASNFWLLRKKFDGIKSFHEVWLFRRKKEGAR